MNTRNAFNTLAAMAFAAAMTLAVSTAGRLPTPAEGGSAPLEPQVVATALQPTGAAPPAVRPA